MERDLDFILDQWCSAWASQTPERSIELRTPSPRRRRVALFAVAAVLLGLVFIPLSTRWQTSSPVVCYVDGRQLTDPVAVEEQALLSISQINKLVEKYEKIITSAPRRVHGVEFLGPDSATAPDGPVDASQE